MKKYLSLILFCLLFTAISAQSSSVYHIETEYSTTNGYSYYFDKLDPQSGTSTRIAQLPIIGYFTGYAFFNCFGNYVFQGIDTTMPNGDYINKLYELDTLGNIIRTIPMDTATGTWYKACLPSAGSPYYFALRYNTTSGQWDLEKINALTGSRTIQVLNSLANYNYWNSDAAITRNDVLWFGMDNQMLGTSVLIRVDPASGQVTFEDTLNAGFNYYYDCLNYDCANDTIYGFIAHMDSVYGAELLKIHGSSGTVLHTGRTAAGTGMFNAGTHTRLADGSFYVKTSSASYLLPDFYVTAPVFTMPVVPTPTTISNFCYAAPREVCSFYTTCEETSVQNNSPNESAVNVFPNPVNYGNLTVQQEGNFTLELMDAAGRVVSTHIATNTITIPVGHLASGLYVIRLTSEDNTVTRKVVINN